MRRTHDSISHRIVDVIREKNEPLETAEIVIELKRETRTKVMYRLNQLRADGLVRGKAIGSGKGTWVWWQR